MKITWRMLRRAFGLPNEFTQRLTKCPPMTRIITAGPHTPAEPMIGTIENDALLWVREAFGVMRLFIGPVVLSVALLVLEMFRETNLDYTAAKTAANRHACNW